MWIRREKATALPAMQAGIENEFNFHPHGCLRDDVGVAVALRYGNVDSRLGMDGDSMPKPS